MLWELGLNSLLILAKLFSPIWEWSHETPTVEGDCSAVGFSLASYYEHHMVLQRAPVHAKIWGYAGHVLDEVTVTVTGSGYQASYTTLATEGTAGRPVWSLSLVPRPAGGPYNITATSKSCNLTITDVLFGDVWFCSGQSNMAFALHMIDNAQDEIDNSVKYTNVRMIQTEMKYATTPQEDLLGIKMDWQLPNPKKIGGFSAVCWLYGRYLFDKYKIPVGLVQSAWGGTRVEAWSPPEALKVCFPNGPTVEPEQNGASHLYNAMIHPYLQMPIYGAIWYQGEANVVNFQYYGCAIQQMVKAWRLQWHTNSPTMDRVFPFGEVQIGPNEKNGTNLGYPGERWSQTHSYGFDPNAKLERFFLAVIIDTPDFTGPIGPIHPRYKRVAARRLLLSGLAVAYGDTSEGLWQGPLPTSYQVQGHNLLITLADRKVELEVRNTNFSTSAHYELCCAVSASVDCNPESENDTGYKWKPTTYVSMTDGTVNVTIPCDMAHEMIMGLRYAWRETPCQFLQQCAVYSKENSLPAPPFYYQGRIM